MLSDEFRTNEMGRNQFYNYIQSNIQVIFNVT